MRLFGLVLGFLLFLAAILGGVFLAHKTLQDWTEKELVFSEERLVDFPSGTSLRKLAHVLEEKGLVSSAQLFSFWIRYFDDYSKFQAGLYRFEGAVSPVAVAKKFRQGDVFTPVLFKYTIPEGFTVRQVVARLVENKIGTESDFESLLSDEDFATSLRLPRASFEGFLYPATYEFSEVPTPREVIARAVETFWEKLPENYIDRVGEKGLSLEQAVNFASLIELETPHRDEMPFVSEVIWNRLNKKMALAIDAALIYGIKDYRGNITRKHLQDRSNKYNTRIHPGLPPSPIGSPSRSALEAVLTPSSKGYYYYVLDLSSGNRHHFSKTLKEHNKWVRKLVRETRARRQKKG